MYTYCGKGKRKNFLSRHWIPLFLTGLFIAAIKRQNSWQLPKASLLLVKLICGCMCESGRQQSAYSLFCVCLYGQRRQAMAHSYGCNMWSRSCGETRRRESFERERDLRRECTEWGKVRNVPLDYSWNVSPVFYWWFDVLEDMRNNCSDFAGCHVICIWLFRSSPYIALRGEERSIWDRV